MKKIMTGLLTGVAFLLLHCGTDKQQQAEQTDDYTGTAPSSVTNSDDEKEEKKDCSSAYRYADDAYTYANRAYSASSLSDLQSYARQAKNSFDDAKNAARSCNCDDARRHSDDGYSYANWAYSASDVSSGQSYARQAKNAADDAKREARTCENGY